MIERQTPILFQDFDTGRPHIVIIDDDVDILDSLEMLFSDRYQVTVCASTKEGIDAVQEDVRAIILDVKMPGQDGFFACAEIRKEFQAIPVIFYSGYQDLKDPYAVINEYHPFGYVNKGDDIQRLIDIVDSAVQWYRVVACSCNNRRR